MTVIEASALREFASTPPKSVRPQRKVEMLIDGNWYPVTEVGNLSKGIRIAFERHVIVQRFVPRNEEITVRYAS